MGSPVHLIAAEGDTEVTFAHIQFDFGSKRKGAVGDRSDFQRKVLTVVIENSAGGIIHAALFRHYRKIDGQKAFCRIELFGERHAEGGCCQKC